jgi:hypothetical protein
MMAPVVCMWSQCGRRWIEHLAATHCEASVTCTLKQTTLSVPYVEPLLTKSCAFVLPLTLTADDLLWNRLWPHVFQVAVTHCDYTISRQPHKWFNRILDINFHFSSITAKGLSKSHYNCCSHFFTIDQNQPLIHRLSYFFRFNIRIYHVNQCVRDMNKVWTNLYKHLWGIFSCTDT